MPQSQETTALWIYSGIKDHQKFPGQAAIRAKIAGLQFVEEQ
jgi:hypothetical protein